MSAVDLTLAGVADQAGRGGVDLVQTWQGAVWAVAPRGKCLRLGHCAGSAGEEARLDELLPHVAAWRESGRTAGEVFGRWHNLADEEGPA